MQLHDVFVSNVEPKVSIRKRSIISTTNILFSHHWRRKFS